MEIGISALISLRINNVRIRYSMAETASLSRYGRYRFTLLSPKKKVGKAPNCYVGISPKGKNVKFLLVTLHVGTSPKFCVKLEYLRKGKNIKIYVLNIACWNISEFGHDITNLNNLT